jgi:hypothetical protein
MVLLARVDRRATRRLEDAVGYAFVEAPASTAQAIRRDP